MSIPHDDVPVGASTTWAWRKVRIRSATRPGDRVVADDSARFGVSKNRRKWTWLEVRYQGGPESTWVVRSHGVAWRFGGWLALEDVLAAVYRESFPWQR